MKNDIKIELPEGTNEFIIREGHAAAVVEPEQFRFDGLLPAPGIFYQKRTAADAKYFDPARAVVEVDYDDRQIRLHRDPTDPRADVVTGTIFAESKLKPFRLNEGAVWKPHDLAVFIRRNRMYFADAEKTAQLIAELQTLKVKTTGEIEIADDNRGNTTRLFSQKTVTTIPVQMVLNLPILSGGEKRRFPVDIHIDVQGGTIQISLESVDLIEMTQNDVRAAMDEQVKIFEQSGIPVLYK